MRELEPNYARHLLAGAIVYGLEESDEIAAELLSISEHSLAGFTLASEAIRSLPPTGEIETAKMSMAHGHFKNALENWGRFCRSHDQQSDRPLVAASLLVAETALLMGSEATAREWMNGMLAQLAADNGDTFYPLAVAFMRELLDAAA